MEEASNPESMHPSNNGINIGNNDNKTVNPNLQFHQWDPGGASNQSSFPGEIPEPQVLWDPGGPRDQFSSQNQSISTFNSLSSCCGESFSHTCPSLDWAKGSDKPGLLASGLLVARVQGKHNACESKMHLAQMPIRQSVHASTKASRFAHSQVVSWENKQFPVSSPLVNRQFQSTDAQFYL